MPDAHALLSPSASSRWLHCPLSVSLEASVPSTDTAYTREGTIAHAMGECMLKTKLGEKPDQTLEELREEAAQEGYDPDEMEDTVRTGYVKEVWALYEALKIRDKNTTMGVEIQVSVKSLDIEQCWGTSDTVIIGDETLIVGDLKYGKGVKVDAHGNTQMRIYALGAYYALGWMYGIKEVTMCIFQPRIKNYSIETISLEELLKWGIDVLKPAAHKALGKEPETHAGTWCRFCKVKGGCIALRDYTFALSDEGRGENYTEAALMTPEELSDALKKLPVVKTWITALEEYIQNRLMEGKPVPGFKLVEGRSITKITDPDGLTKELIEDGYCLDDILQPQQLKTLTDLKKLIGKRKQDLLTPYINKPKGKPTVAPDDDPRPPFSEAEDPETMFEGME